jgi:hypothetical protein
VEEGVIAMADKDKPEDANEKKKGLLGGSKVPLDAVLLVVAPFVTFVMLFMYVMGLLPPRPMTVRVVGAAPMEEAEKPAVSGREEAVLPSSVDNPTRGGEVRDQAGIVPLPPEPIDKIPIDAGGAALPEQTSEETASEARATEEGAEDELSGGAVDVDEDRMERIKQLAKVYEQMNASSVAAIVTTMNEDDAVDILSNMKPRNAAKVLASLAPEKAATLSLRLTE